MLIRLSPTAPMSPARSVNSELVEQRDEIEVGRPASLENTPPSARYSPVPGISAGSTTGITPCAGQAGDLGRRVLRVTGMVKPRTCLSTTLVPGG